MVWRAWGRTQNNGMASREKKARSVTADSPTPSLGSANSGSNSNISALATTPSTNAASATGGTGSDSAPTTPTSTRKGAAGAGGNVNLSSAVSGNVSGSGSSTTSTTRGSLSRLKSKQQLLQQNTGEETTGEDTTSVVTGGGDSIVTTPSRTTRGGGASRDDSAGRDSPATYGKDDPALSVSASKDVTKSPAIGARRAATVTSKTATSDTSTADTRKNRVVKTLKRTTLLKRKGKKIIGKPMLGRKVVARRQLMATAKTTGTRGAAALIMKKEAISPTSSKEKEEELHSTPSLRNGKPRNSDSPVAKRKSTTVGLKHQESSKSLDSLTGSIKMERRRSGSVSKCSDMTEDGEPTGADIKRELFDYDARSKVLDKMAEAFNERKTGGGASPVVAGAKDDKSSGGTLRRSMRQRKSTARDKEDFLSPRGKAGSSMDIKIEPAESFESLSADGETESNVSVAAPLTIDTTETEVAIGAEPLHSDGVASSVGDGSSSAVSGGAGVGAGGEEELVVGKDPSLSPGELVSEGVSEQSVKECYSEPAFLENNLGIEKDPKLGEIVQERFRCDKVSDDVDANADDAQTATGMGSSVTSDNGGGVMKIDDHDVVVAEAVEPTGKELEVVPTGTEKPTVEDEAMEVVEQDSVEDKAKVIRKNDQESELQKEKDMGNSGECGDEPMEAESVVFSGELDKNIESEKMDLTAEEETEVVECAKEFDKPEEITEVAQKQEDVMIILDEAAEVVDVPQKTDENPTKELVVEEKESVHTGDEDRDNDASQTSGVTADVVELSSGSKPTENSTASSPASAATEPCKTNGESNGIATGGTRDQSTPNQPASRAGQQKPPVVSVTTPKPTTPGNGKETKAKARTTKEKTKEDEKTREEKLRQEKLRVEEKVREEKQRAERLEAEKRLKEELLQQKMLENGLEAEATTLKTAASTKSGGSSPAADKETKTELTAAMTTALGGLNLPAITIAITKKDSDNGSADEKEREKPKSELEILSIKADGSTTAAVGLLSKDEKPAKEGGAAAPSLADTAESRSRNISKSETAAAAVSVAERKDSNKSPTATTSALSIIKIENSNGSPVTVGSGSTPPPQLPATTTGKKKDATEERKTILLDESDDAAKQKESHLKHLGLLTIQAASEEKLRRAEQKPAASVNDSSLQDGTAGGSAGSTGTGAERGGWLSSGTANQSSTGSGRSSGNKSSRSSKDEYTVSMKTAVVKGNGGSGGSRGEKRKQQRMPLKMTFQKGKGKGTPGSTTTGRDSSNGSGTSSNGSGYATDTGNNGDNAFYTAHINELDHHSSNSSDGHSHRESGAGGGRKAHSRSHTTDGVNLTETVGETASSKEVIQKSLVIPEKASSFNVHPERLCWDQCSYCGGKFGLYDTPCHVAAIKSTERQQRILLATLPKITLDSCLCDACYRHVDRKANCPPQKKKTAAVPQTSGTSTGGGGTANAITFSSMTIVSPLVLKVTTNKDGSTSIATEQPATVDDGTTAGGKEREICAVRQCAAHGMQSLRRKWMVKMKRKISKQLDINFEQAAKATAEYIYICNKHYEQISNLMVCAMCTKPLQRNHVYHLYNNIVQLERLIQEQGLSMRLNSSELVVCKICKYYANLLMKPPEAGSRREKFVKNYNHRLYTYRQRVAEEQDSEVRSVEKTVVAPPTRQRPSIPVTDIVISDGDEEEEELEEDEVEECPAPPQQQPQQPEARYQTFGNLFSIGDSSVSLRRRVSNRKSPDVTIVENNVATQMGELDEISIIPASKSLAALNQQQQSQDDNIDMTKVLKSNPNISMRELFPGEEELGVHVNIPFSSSCVRTPEGWTKVTSTIQYDDSTRALWEELQKPYGNQSSFLRHLILLEKYFRNGDLVLSPQAKNNATTYSEAVQNRLRSYDNLPSSVPTSPPALTALASVTPNAAAEKTSNIFQQFSSATITIVPASKVRPKPGTAAALSNTGNASDVTPVSPPAPVSLLKSNNLHLANSSGEQGTKTNLKRKLSNEGGRSAAGNISFGGSTTSTPLHNSGSNVAKVVKLDEPKAPLSSPPELISINCKPSVTITSIPTGQPASAPSPATTAQKQLSLLNQSYQPMVQPVPAVPAKKSPPATTVSPAAATSNASGSATREIIHMPEQLTEAERRESSTRPWRPTLLPISPGVSESLKTGPLYQTADGRLLPKLVQVMSGGKPYHISIEDYNRMCILRREKLLQQQHNMIQTANKRQSQLPQPRQPATTVQPPPALRLTNASVENTLINSNVPTTSGTSGTSGAKVVQFPNQLLEQNSLIPIFGGGGTSKSGTGNGNVQKSSSSNSSLTVTMTPSVNNNTSLAKGTTVIPPAMKPLSLPNSTTVFPMMMSANTISLPPLFTTSASLFPGVGGGVTTQTSSSSSSMNNRPSSATTSLVLAQPTTHLSVANVTTMNPLDQLLKGGNMVTQAQLQEYVAAATAANGGMLGASSQMDNSPDKLLSKIPKSLTVIPQQKQNRTMSRVSSHEEQNSA